MSLEDTPRYAPLYTDQQATPSAYPDDNPKTVMGLAKPSLSNVPPIALFEIGRAMADGARKYGRFNYREHAITASTYYDAAMRHLMAWWDGEELAQDSGVPHLAHAAACICIAMDAQSLGKLNDDRKFPGKLPEFLAANTQKAAAPAATPDQQEWRWGLCVDPGPYKLTRHKPYQLFRHSDELYHVKADDGHHVLAARDRFV